MSSDLSWLLDSTTMHGTMVMPVGAPPVPGVVMVAGSGPTDRDWNSPLLPGSNGTAPLIAKALARAGFASLRYDKRASGPNLRQYAEAHVGQISMQSHVDELAAAVRTLAGVESVNGSRIFALTNSEGALHALHYQLSSPQIPFAGLVLTGAPGRPVGDVGRAQLAAQAAALPNGDALMQLYDAAITRFLTGEPVDPDPQLPAGVLALVQSLSSPFNLPFARELWTADAATLLGQIAVPMLVIIGRRDIQVDWQADGDPLQRAAAGNKDVTFAFPEHANHVLKHESRARSELTAADATTGYNAPGAELDPDVEATILGWLRTHA